MNSHSFTEDISHIYSLDNERRKHLAEMVEIVAQQLTNLELHLDAADAERLKERVSSETFKVLIIGEFNTGKSTFINALLGAEVLPTKAIPATAIINQLRYGEHSSARLHFRDPKKEPLSIPIEALNEYVLIKNNEQEEDARKEIRESPFSHAEIEWPLPLCRDNNVEIIDSPGLNESQVREDVTLDYLRQVDAVLFLMSAVHFGPAQSEMETLEMLKSAGHQDLFFVINRWDLLRRNEPEEVRSKALTILPALTHRPDDIYFISALDALDGRIGNNASMEERSGIIGLEKRLHKFLAEERGRMKALRGARELRLIVRKLEKESIPQKVHLLKMPLSKLQEKHLHITEDLKRLEQEKQTILQFVERERTQIKNLSESRIREFFYATDRKVGSWAEEYEVDLGWLDIFHPKEKIREIVVGLSDHLTNKLTDSFKEWERQTLSPFLQERFKSLHDELQTRASGFENRLQDIELALNGTDFQAAEVTDEFGPKTALDRLLAAAGGWALAGPGLGAVGALFGWQEMFKSLLPNIVAILGAIVIGLPLLPVLLIVNAVAMVKTADRIGDAIKEKVAEKFRENLHQGTSGHVEKIVDQLDKHLTSFKNTLEKGIQRKISEVKEKVNAALAAHKKGEKEVKAQLDQIEETATELHRINQELDTFIEALATPQN